MCLWLAIKAIAPAVTYWEILNLNWIICAIIKKILEKKYVGPLKAVHI